MPIHQSGLSAFSGSVVTTVTTIGLSLVYLKPINQAFLDSKMSRIVQYLSFCKWPLNIVILESIYIIASYRIPSCYKLYFIVHMSPFFHPLINSVDSVSPTLIIGRAEHSYIFNFWRTFILLSLATNCMPTTNMKVLHFFHILTSTFYLFYFCKQLYLLGWNDNSLWFWLTFL